MPKRLPQKSAPKEKNMAHKAGSTARRDLDTDTESQVNEMMVLIFDKVVVKLSILGFDIPRNTFSLLCRILKQFKKIIDKCRLSLFFLKASQDLIEKITG